MTDTNPNGTDQIAAALAKAQAQMTVAAFDQVNPHFKSRFASLASVIDAVRKPLTDNGIAYLQRADMQQGGVAVETIFYHTSGQRISAGAIFIPVDRANAHAVGSAITYAKRYGLALACGIAADEDDDGNQAVSKPTKPTKAALQNFKGDGDIKVDEGKGSEYVAGLQAAHHNEDAPGALELMDELGGDQDLQIWVWDKLNSSERSWLKKVRKEAA